MNKLGILFIVVVAISILACKRTPIPGLESANPNGGGTSNPIDTTGNGGTTNPDPCSPDSVYFESQILPILTSNCALSGCHDVITHEKDIILTNYTNVVNTGEISVNNPYNSDMFEVITDTDPDKRMPPAPLEPLSSEQVALILKWMQQGAQNLTCIPDCDTTVFTYNLGVKPILQQKCLGCHSGSQPQGNITLNTYQTVKTMVDNGKLIGSITHSYGNKPMPYPVGNAKLPACEITIIQKWVNAGAQNN